MICLHQGCYREAFCHTGIPRDIIGMISICRQQGQYNEKFTSTFIYYDRHKHTMSFIELILNRVNEQRQIYYVNC